MIGPEPSTLYEPESHHQDQLTAGTPEQAVKATAEQYLAEGQISKVKGLLRQAIVHPQLQQEALAMLCSLHLQLGEIEAAEQYAANLTKQDDQALRTLESQARVYIAKGQIERAIELCQEAVAHDPDTPGKYLLLGTIQLIAGLLDSAEQTSHQAISQLGEDPHLLCLSAQTHKQRGALQRAQQDAAKACRLDPGFAMAHFVHGSTLHCMGQLNEAAEALEKALALKPSLKEAVITLGLIRDEQKQFQASLKIWKQAVRMFKPTADDHLRLGNAHRSLGMLSEAEKHYQEALQIKPQSASILTSYGVCLQLQGRVEEAINAYFMAVLTDSNHAIAHLNLGLALLLLGDYQSGWREYRWRKAVLQYSSPELLSFTELEDLKEPPQAILLSHEQGAGDFFQFIRYGALLKSQGTIVHLACPSQVAGIAARTGWFASISSNTERLDLNKEKIQHVTMLSLPELLGVTRDEPLINTPYLTAPHERIEHWRANLRAGKDAPLVGLSWQGNPDTELTTLLGRSMPLQEYAPLFNTETEVNWVALQKGHGSEQLADFAWKHRFTANQPVVSETWDFVECSAIMENCDLILTTDTGVAHLAGALGRPVWLLLTLVPDWRWGLEGDTTTWYPSMRLFRQREYGNWGEVMARVNQEFQCWLTERASMQPRCS
jgi:tetratricopeptide (TPR) repeat protein